MEPPVVAVRGSQTLEEGRAELLAVAPAAQADRAARLVDEERIARELRHVLVDQIEAARGFSSDERAQRLDVLPLAPRRPGHGSARRLGGRARRRGVALDDGDQRDAAVSQRESFVGFHGCREARLGAGPERQQPVHAFLEPLGRDGRRGGDGQPVAVGDGHREASILTRVAGAQAP